MKKLIISLLFLVPFVTGCADIDNRLTLNDDKSASIVTSITYQGDLSNKFDEHAINISNNYDKFLDPLYNVEKAYGAKLSTITATKSVKNVQKEDIDLSSLGFTSKLPGGRFIEYRKNFLISSFNIDCVFDYNTQASKLEKIEKPQIVTQKTGLEPEYYHKYNAEGDFNTSDDEFDFASNLDSSAKMLAKQDIAEADKEETKFQTDNKLKTSFSIQLPSFASYNNADSMVGTVYTWKIKKDGPTEIKLQYVQYSGFAICFVILLGILLLVFVAKKILKRDTQKRLDNIENIV
ncbi:hypothetical protein IJ541_09780 [bacterium]|nr:hypothetical protein [bacterium]